VPVEELKKSGGLAEEIEELGDQLYLTAPVGSSLTNQYVQPSGGE